jgi:large repetitive protein
MPMEHIKLRSNTTDSSTQTSPYNAGANRFTSFVVLTPGQNIFEIIVTNACGTAQDSRVIILNVPTMAPPIVTYRNPSLQSVQYFRADA